MPIWLQVLLSVVETIIEQLVKNPPKPDAPQSEHDDHAAQVAKANAVKDLLNA